MNDFIKVIGILNENLSPNLSSKFLSFSACQVNQISTHMVWTMLFCGRMIFFSRLVFFIKQPLIPRYKRKISPSEIQHQISTCWGEWGGKEVSPHQKQLSNTSRASYNSTQSCHYLPRDIIRFHRLKTQSYKTVTLLPQH